jgi:hypothetical protein
LVGITKKKEYLSHTPPPLHEFGSSQEKNGARVKKKVTKKGGNKKKWQLRESNPHD